MDAAGNESDPDTFTWFVDLTAPNTTIDDSPPNPDNDATPTFEFSGTDNHSDPADLTFECKVDDGNWDDCDSPETLATLADGEHTFRVRATDEAGNTDASPAEYTWTIDTVKPVSEASAPATTNETDATFDVHYDGVRRALRPRQGRAVREQERRCVRAGEYGRLAGRDRHVRLRARR